jgi:hypothetical protein
MRVGPTPREPDSASYHNGCGQALCQSSLEVTQILGKLGYKGKRRAT